MSAKLLSDPSACRLVAGELEATFLPAHGMLGASFTRRGVELLGRVEDLDRAAREGRTAGVPLLHPWANRLAGFAYRSGGRDVVLDRHSRWLRFDANGLPIHGVPWSMLAWSVVETSPTRVAARFDWSSAELCAVFPFPHRLGLDIALDATSLTVATTLTPIAKVPVPVSFGFHPYFAIPRLPRDAWRLHLPPMRELVLDERRIPTGATRPFAGFDEPLEAHAFDCGYVLDREQASMSIDGGGLSIAVDWLDGYRYAQVYAPTGQALVALEPMTAPTNALVSGEGLHCVAPGSSFHAAFRIRVV